MKKEQKNPIDNPKNPQAKPRLKENPASKEKYDSLDQELDQSFPASDPPSHTPPEKKLPASEKKKK